MKNLTKIIAILIFSVSTVFAQSIDLSKDWKYAVGDQSDWAKPSFNDKDWKKMSEVINFEHAGEVNFKEFGWMRKSVVIPAFMKIKAQKYGYIMLLLGKVDDVDETFFNGKKIGGFGSFPPNYLSAYDVLRFFKISLDDVNWDKPNTIAVRIYDGPGNGGMYGGPYKIICPGEDILVESEELPRFKIENSLKAYKCSVSLSPELQKLWDNTQGYILEIGISSKMKIFLNNEFLEDTKSAKDIRIFINKENLKKDSPNSLMLYLPKETSYELLLVAKIALSKPLTSDLYRITSKLQKIKRGEVVMLPPVPVEINNLSTSAFNGVLKLDLVTDENIVLVSKEQKLSIEPMQKFENTYTLKADFAGQFKINYTMIESSTGEASIGCLYTGILK